MLVLVLVLVAGALGFSGTFLQLTDLVRFFHFGRLAV